MRRVLRNVIKIQYNRTNELRKYYNSFTSITLISGPTCVANAFDRVSVTVVALTILAVIRVACGLFSLFRA